MGFLTEINFICRISNRSDRPVLKMALFRKNREIPPEQIVQAIWKVPDIQPREDDSAMQPGGAHEHHAARLFSKGGRRRRIAVLAVALAAILTTVTVVVVGRHAPR